MGMQHKLEHWVTAGLITEAQRVSIASHERERSRHRYGRGLVGAGLFAILAGILSIVAANWAYIDGSLKLAVHFLLNILVTLALFRAWREGSDMRREGLLLLFFGLNLTLIALIGQVFQLDGNLANALILWMLVSTPAMFWIGRTNVTGIPWIIAFLAMICAAFSEYVEPLPDFWAAFYGFGLSLLLPMAFIADGRLNRFRSFSPAYANLFVHTGYVLLALSATASTFLWYGLFGHDLPRMLAQAGLSSLHAHLALAAIPALAATGLFFYALLADFFQQHHYARSGLIFIAVSATFISVPWLLMPGDADILAQISFIAYWIFVGWIAHRIDAPRLISLAIALVGIRIFIIYWEAFGGLLNQGIGLIVGGVFMLLLVVAARRLNRRILSTREVIE